MKSIFFLGTVMLLSWTIPTWAIPASAPVSEEQPAATEATTLNTVEVGIEASSQNNAERLTNLSQRINRSVEGAEDPQADSEMPSLKQVLNLPPDMVIRGTSGGGLAIGTEY